GGDQDLCGRDSLLADRDGVAIHQPAAAHMQLHAGAIEQSEIDAVQSIDLLLDIVAQGRPGMGRARGGPAVSHGVLELVGKLRTIDEEFLGHAAPDHAGAADPVILKNAHARAVAGRDPRGPHAARTCADDEKVVIKHHVDNPRTKPQHGLIWVAPATISALTRPGKGNGASVFASRYNPKDMLPC